MCMEGCYLDKCFKNCNNDKNCMDNCMNNIKKENYYDTDLNPYKLKGKENYYDTDLNPYKL